ncbi:helix-turn-helix domain-containing protein [Desulfovibrio desulfuricans]|uniref:helix-turn-helix domain-containing protein n=1 Tax=Desulfovibrio desulfuricans TaxID=876 RepID=UPI0035ADA56C
MSPRSFARVFPAETGSSPARFVEGLRLSRARELVESGVDSFAEVARLSGFGSEDRLRKTFARRLGISPYQYRRHFLRG